MSAFVMCIMMKEDEKTNEKDVLFFLYACTSCHISNMVLAVEEFVE